MTEQSDEPNSVVNRRFGYKKGWRLAYPDAGSINIPLRLQQLTESHLVSEEAKDKARKLLAEIVDGRLPSASFDEARSLIQRNKVFSKTRIKIADTETKAVIHAVFMACQACENLRDRKFNIACKEEKNKVMGQIASAINALSEAQLSIMGGSDD